MKPTKGKILVLIAIFSLSIIVGARFWEKQYQPSFGPEDKTPPVWTYYYVSYFYPLWPVSFFMPGRIIHTIWAKNQLGIGIITVFRGRDFSGEGIGILKYFLILPPPCFLIVNTIYWYFLSCLVVFTYSKFIDRKEKNREV